MLIGRRYLSLGLIAAALLLAVTFVPRAMGEPLAVSLGINPDKLTLQPGARGQDVVVIAHADAAGTFKEASLSALAGDGLTVAIKSNPLLPASGDLAWTVRVTATERAAKDSTIAFRLDYGFAPSGGASGATVRGIAATTFSVSYAPLALSKAIEASIQNGFKTLKPNKIAKAVLTVTNNGIDEIRLTEVKAVSPDYINVLPVAGLPAAIPGRNSRSIEFELQPMNSVAQGEVPLLLRLRLTRGAGAAQQSESKFVVDPVTVGIPGLSDITTVLQIPSLFILPGLLIVLTWSLIWQATVPAPAAGGDKPAFPLSYKSEGFYLVAVTLSLVIAFLYAWRKGQPVDFFERVSLQDIAVIWFGSVFVVAPVLYFVVFVWVRKAVREIRAWNFARNNPLKDDEAHDILEKLARKKMSIQMDAFSVNDKLLFKLPFGKAETDHSWVVPPIHITVAPAKKEELGVEVDKCIGGGQAKCLVDLLKKNPGTCSVTWQPSAGLAHPCEMENASLNQPQGAQMLVSR